MNNHNYIQQIAAKLDEADTINELLELVNELREDGYFRDDLDDVDFPPDPQNNRPRTGQVRANISEMDTIYEAKAYLQDLLGISPEEEVEEVHNYSTPIRINKNLTNAIDLSPFEEGDEVIRLNNHNKHIFHRNTLESWWKVAKKQTNPLTRSLATNVKRGTATLKGGRRRTRKYRTKKISRRKLQSRKLQSRKLQSRKLQSRKLQSRKLQKKKRTLKK